MYRRDRVIRLDKITKDEWTRGFNKWNDRQIEKEKEREKTTDLPYDNKDKIGDRRDIEQEITKAKTARESMYEHIYDNKKQVGKSSTKQVGGSHYKDSPHQPLEIVLETEGYEAFKGACLTKIYKYLQRKKDYRLEDFKKAQHVLGWLIEETENEQ